jgi:hypothetical protein
VGIQIVRTNLICMKFEANFSYVISTLLQIRINFCINCFICDLLSPTKKVKNIYICVRILYLTFEKIYDKFEVYFYISLQA